MKSVSLLLLSTVWICQAALIPFGISPAGSDNAVELSPANEVPPLPGNGSGGELTRNGVVFDTATDTLHLSVGYGSTAGFTDLTGAAVALGLCGPAPTHQIAAPIFDLEPLTIRTNPAHGGIISGDVHFTSSYISNLLSGLDYINIATAKNRNGEIRGQLVPLDIPPVLNCPAAGIVACSSQVDFTATVNDTVGNAVNVVWWLNGSPVQTNSIPAFVPPAATNVVFTATLPMGTNLLQIAAVNAAGSSASCSTTVTVADTNPPVILRAAASPNVLWPPNHKFVKVNVTANVTDTCNAASWKIVGVQSNERGHATGSGHTSPDWQILDDHTLNLRAERNGSGKGRIYTITLQAQDSAGNLSLTKKVRVTVPHSHGRGTGHGEDDDKGDCDGNGKGDK